MIVFLVASGASLTIGIGLGCRIVTRRDAFQRDAQTASDPIPHDHPSPGGRASRPTRSPRP